MSTPNKPDNPEPGGMPLIPKFHKTGLTAKAALALGAIETGMAHEGTLEAIAVKVKASKAHKMVKTDLLGAPAVPKAEFSITLPPDLHTRLRKPVTGGSGGWQSLMADLYVSTEAESPVCHITHQTLGKLVAYAVKHGSGGYQGVIRHVLCLVVAQHNTVLGIGADLGGE